MSDELNKLLKRVHNEITIFDFDGIATPCIIVSEEKYDKIISSVINKALTINTDLNILHDGLGNVFVEIFLTFAKVDIEEKFLINAKKDIMFFESLAKTSMIAISSPKSHYGKDNVFMIQLPKPEKAQNALEIIKQALISNNK